MPDKKRVRRLTKLSEELAEIAEDFGDVDVAGTVTFMLFADGSPFVASQGLEKDHDWLVDMMMHSWMEYFGWEAREKDMQSSIDSLMNDLQTIIAGHSTVNEMRQQASAGIVREMERDAERHWWKDTANLSIADGDLVDLDEESEDV